MVLPVPRTFAAKLQYPACHIKQQSGGRHGERQPRNWPLRNPARRAHGCGHCGAFFLVPWKVGKGRGECGISHLFNQYMLMKARPAARAFQIFGRDPPAGRLRRQGTSRSQRVGRPAYDLPKSAYARRAALGQTRHVKAHAPRRRNCTPA